MDLLEYLETVTEGIPSNVRARVVRREISAHFAQLKSEMMTDGYDPVEAEKLAFERLGDPHALSREMASSERVSLRRPGGQALATVIAIVGALWTPSYPPAIALVLGGGLAGTVLRGGVFSLRELVTSLASAVRRARWLVSVTAVLAIVIGAWPLIAAGIHDSLWRIPGGVLLPYPALALLALALVLLVRQFVRDPGEGWILAYLGAAVIPALAILTGLILWRIYPAPPSRYVDWFVGPSMVGPNGALLFWTSGFPQGLPWWEQPVIQRPLVMMAVWFCGAMGLGAIVWAIKSWRDGLWQAPSVGARV